MMTLSVREIDILSSKVGPGLKIGDNTFGCARITAAELEDGKTLRDCALEGLCLGYKGILTGEGKDQKPEIVLDETDISAASNYVLFYQNDENGASVIHNTTDLVKLFKLPETDAVELDKYLDMLADQRNLELTRYMDKDTNTEALMFVNKFDREIIETVLDEGGKAAVPMYNGMMQSSEFRSELTSHNFIKMFVMSIVQTGQDRYNKLNRDDVLLELARSFSSITYWKEGELRVPSVKDINDYMDTIRENIFIQ